jgi:hypothetical protein
MAGRDISLWPLRYQPAFTIPVYYLSQFVPENCTIWLNSLHFQITQPGLGDFAGRCLRLHHLFTWWNCRNPMVIHWNITM